MKNIIKIIIIFTGFYLIYTNRSLVILSTLKSIKMFNESLFPSIFPIIILSDFILSTNLINIISKLIGNIFNKLFNISKVSSYVFILSCISGSPSNSKYIKDLLDNKLITKKEAEKLLSFSCLYNPLLIISLTKYLCLKDSIIIIIINIICNILIGIINRNYKIDISNTLFKVKKFNLVESINKSINTLIILLGVVTFFNILNGLININHPLISGIFEITSGLYLLNDYPISYSSKLLYTGILLSFSGLSIIIQTKSIFAKDTLDYSLFYKSRIIHLILMIIIIIFLYN